MKKLIVILSAGLIAVGAFRVAPALAQDAAAGDQELASQAYGLLKKYCYKCHGVEFAVPGYNVLDRDSIIKDQGPDAEPYVSLESPEDSQIWSRALVGEDEADMPPDDNPRPSAEEKEILKRWIQAGAPYPVAVERPIITHVEAMQAVRDHLLTFSEDNGREHERKFQRYFSLVHMHNNRSVTDADLRLYRAALSKVINSLSYEPDIIVPKAIDQHGTLLNVDLRDLGWHVDDNWKQVVQRYPYGLIFDNLDNEAVQDVSKLRRLCEEVYSSDMADTKLPYVRADWFVVSATTGDLYDHLLKLPADVKTLEENLGVDALQNLEAFRVIRGGVFTSGVSRQNRLLERHPTSFGAYWKSYDFLGAGDDQNLALKPLGPKFEGNPHDDFAFKHDGGELIFNLPNGLQAYYLAKGDDTRLEGPAPIEVVEDKLKTSGSSQIVNGLSCMSCHRKGMIRFKDQIRDGARGLDGDAREFLTRVYVPQEELDRWFDRDEKRFMTALTAAMGPFLLVGEDQDKDLTDFPEPINALAVNYYHKDLGLEDVAREVGWEGSVESLKAAISGNTRLMNRLGMRALLAEEGRIKRLAWQDSTPPATRFQHVAQELNLGDPLKTNK